MQDCRRSAEHQGMYSPSYEHDSCGVGFVAHIKGHQSNSIVRNGLKILENLTHRGAVGSDPLMGDGAGILLQIPDQLFREEMAKQGVTLPPVGEYGVGMIFLPKENASRLACEHEMERAIRAEGQEFLGWRDVPVNQEMPMSPAVLEKKPVIRQVFIGRGKNVMVTDALERKLYVIRKRAVHAINKLQLKHVKEYFTPSMSARTVVYKGLLLANQVGQYYTDLLDPRCASALALVHQRFSTNTFPEWPLAHPYRMIAHNGEINTVKGNFNWVRAREGVMESAILGNDLPKLYPLIFEGQSDTACFDNCLELLVMAGYPIAQAMMMMIPEAWEHNPNMDANRRAFYEYHAAMMEPWDGPAAMAFTDGKQIGATLDRNGLRPARYFVTEDDLVVLASEAGTLPFPEHKIVKKWRLQPGKMLLIDLEAGQIIGDDELKGRLSSFKPYKQWIDSITVKLEQIRGLGSESIDYKESLLDRQQAFGYTQEDLKILMTPMMLEGAESVGSMGNDSPLAVLSDKHKTLFNYFKQLFAQVTNPPIDPIRESLVMSLVTYISPKPNILDLNNVNPPMRLEATQPILTPDNMAKVRRIQACTGGKFSSYELDICYPVVWGNEGVEARIASLCAEAKDAVVNGHNILIISDRKMNRNQVAIPALLALSAIHQHLIREGLRTNAGLVVETGSAREVHHFAVLAGFGAEAVYPYLAMETIEQCVHANTYDISVTQAIDNYVSAIGKGLKKIMSKMGISTYRSYAGAQIFEAVGLSQALVDRYFSGVSTKIEGLSVFDVAQEAIELHQMAFSDNPVLMHELDAGGEYAWRVRGEAHLWSPDSIAKLQHSVRSNHYQTYQEYANLINDQTFRHMTIRGLLDFNVKPDAEIALDEVESVEEIVKRFTTGAMSLGSISTEAHATLAIAMNRIGGKSNTGEGGEDPLRYRHELQHGLNNKSVQGVIKKGDTLATWLGQDNVLSDIPLQAGDSLRSRIKQVASGRFGVTADYLISADQIQIKMAQGAKPGEGGQLPGGKVSEYIAKLRYSVPGVGLISPPPHHDIYSIEDLAQLIHDLKNVNPEASISVKLVSVVGVGTVAAGVSKAKADHLVIAGHDGGTGASPQSSIKHAGTPWELGLAETQHTLVVNGLRSRVRVQVDGQMKTGRDVVMGALFGADEFGFATAPLVAQGCIMMRKCHLNTCPVGVATQDPVLRRKFKGQPEHVVNYFFFVAQEVREIMAKLGVRRFNDLIGQTQYLIPRQNITHWKAKQLDLSRLLWRQHGYDGTLYHSSKQEHGLHKALDQKLIRQAKNALDNQEKMRFSTPIKNLHRTVGAMLSGKIAKKYGEVGLPEGTLYLDFLGTAGQSFGAFLAAGVVADLEGEANDYVGKGLSGGTIVVRPNQDFQGLSSENMIVGNTVLYGATSGQAFFSGVAGERFAVRNSGANAVVEATGDHGCEYMTGGTVVVLGLTGRNFAAGMSGGVAYVYDMDGRFASRCNLEQVELEPVLPKREQMKLQSPAVFHRLTRAGMPQVDEEILKQLVSKHVQFTHSERGQFILDHWDSELKRFVKVFPSEYQRALKQLYQHSNTAQAELA